MTERECLSTGHVCPECATGKHGNCDNTAYCSVDDTIVPCECEHDQPPLP